MGILIARDIMNRDVLTVRADWLVEQLADFLVENSISGAPVISEDGKLIGVVSSTDIVRYKSIPISNPQPDTPHEYYIHAPDRLYSAEEIESLRIEAESLITVRDIMTPMTLNVTEGTSVQQVADSMIRGRIHRVLVTENDVLIGIITSMDMLKIIRDL
ncbi:MAG: CBS domain-containing protein [Deltaproteobacteria bacterium]|nr:CBS domain-containing protein [Deltaproteobacteria bacterium]